MYSSAEREQLEETISTLKFATRMMKVSTDAVVNVVLDPMVHYIAFSIERDTVILRICHVVFVVSSMNILHLIFVYIYAISYF